MIIFLGENTRVLFRIRIIPLLLEEKKYVLFYIYFNLINIAQMHTFARLERVIRNKINSRSGYFLKEFCYKSRIRFAQIN